MKQKIIILFKIIIVELLLFQCFLMYIKPEPSLGIYLVIILPILFFVNWIIAGVMYLIYNEHYKCFIYNSFLSVLLMYLLFSFATYQNIKKHMQTWSVTINKTEYEIIWYKEDNTFRVSINLGDGFYRGLDMGEGKVNLKNDTIFFIRADSTCFSIHNDCIYDFMETKKHNLNN